MVLPLDSRRLWLLEKLLEGRVALPSLLDDPDRWYAFQTVTFEPVITRTICRYKEGGLLLHDTRKGNAKPDPHGHLRDIGVHVYDGSYAMTRGTCVDGIPGIQGAPEIISVGMQYTLLTSESHTVDVLSDRVLSVCYVGKRGVESASHEEIRVLGREERRSHLDLFRPYV